MKYEWDEAKNERNIKERGIAFGYAENFEWTTSLIVEDTRQNYGERRFQAMGYILGKLHVLVYTIRQESIRIISLRRANEREEKIHEKALKN